ncbi:hypothetical protein [Paenibacillus caseinilyticus]|nr:hypothetical protein [Paenibacillus caseinilyticus]
MISVIVSLVYLGYVWRSFRLVSQERNASHTMAASEGTEWQNEKWFSWKAFISIAASSVILFALGKSAVLWNYVPFIAIGSAIAVILAFSIEFKHRSQ